MGADKNTGWHNQRSKQILKYTIAVVPAALPTATGYSGIRRLIHKDPGFTPAKRFAKKGNRKTRQLDVIRKVQAAGRGVVVDSS